MTASTCNSYPVTAVDNKLVVGKAKSTMTATAKEATSHLGQSVSDSWITSKVRSTLMYSSINGSDISVTTRNGVVTLRGKVASDAEYALAVALANNVRGVSRVDARGLNQS